MQWSFGDIGIEENFEIPPGAIPSANSVKGMIIGCASAPLLLVSIYFFKANSVFFSKEYFISLISYVCALFVLYVGISWYHFPIVISSLQILPFVNQVFMGSFSLNIENCISICLGVVSMYSAALVYVVKVNISTYSTVAVVLFIVCGLITLVRVLDSGMSTRRHLDKMRLSDLLCMVLLTLEASVEFVSLCSFAISLKGSMVLLGTLASACFLLPLEKALYYYPASAVIPVLTIFIRLFGAFLSHQLFMYESKTLVWVSLTTGILSVLFPLIMS